LTGCRDLVAGGRAALDVADVGVAVDVRAARTSVAHDVAVVAGARHDAARTIRARDVAGGAIADDMVARTATAQVGAAMVCNSTQGRSGDERPVARLRGPAQLLGRERA
jgi:hypothetical protein